MYLSEHTRQTEISWEHKRGHQSSEGILRPCFARLHFKSSLGRLTVLPDICLLQPLYLQMFLPRTTLSMLEFQHCIFHSPTLWPFLPIQGFPHYTDKTCKGWMPCGKPSPSHGSALHPSEVTGASVLGAPGWQLSQASACGFCVTD